jgi:glycosyltransferase involved in cell wall biosynthesis
MSGETSAKSLKRTGSAKSHSDILLVSTADWDNPFWTNKQHVAVELAKAGHKVLYLESQGLRQPTMTGRDLGRIWRRLKQGLRPPRKVRPNLWVWSPTVLPFHKFAAVRKINRVILGLGWRIAAGFAGLKPSLLWTYSPLTTELYDISRFECVVYHAVDDIKAQPGMPRDSIAIGEEALSKQADIIFCTAPAIQDRLEKFNPCVFYLSNVADFDHFSRAIDESTPIPTDLLEIPAPRIGFVGAVSAYKLDLPLLVQVARRRPEWSFVMIGEVGEGDPHTNVAQLADVKNIHLIGPRAYGTLPAYLKGFSAAILPSALNEYTTSMFPMKFFEYLAAGLPVVSTKLPALAEYGHVASLAENAEAFEAALASALSGEGPDLASRLAAAQEKTYSARTAKMLRLIDERSAAIGS